ncbi:hypothetical protein MTO96_043715 [Rhipicephalus appendiculatus]
MNAAIPPPPFLQCPGEPPVPWRQWRPVLQAYIDAAARDATPEHKKALLLNGLGDRGGWNRYLRMVEDEPQPASGGETQDAVQDAYLATLKKLDAIYDEQLDPTGLRAAFKALRQGPDESAVQFILEVRRLARLCNFGATSDILAFDQIVAGIASPHLKRKFFKMGQEFTIQKALNVAKEEERVDRALQQVSALTIDAVSSRPTRHGGAKRRPRQEVGQHDDRLAPTPRSVAPSPDASQAGAGFSPSASTPASTAGTDYSPASPAAISEFRTTDSRVRDVKILLRDISAVTDIKLYHVPGHSGLFGNELADFLASRAARMGDARQAPLTLRAVRSALRREQLRRWELDWREQRRHGPV